MKELWRGSEMVRPGGRRLTSHRTRRLLQLAIAAIAAFYLLAAINSWLEAGAPGLPLSDSTRAVELDIHDSTSGSVRLIFFDPKTGSIACCTDKTPPA